MVIAVITHFTDLLPTSPYTRPQALVKVSLEVLGCSPGALPVLLTRKVPDARAAGSSLLEPCPTLVPGTQVAFPGAESSQVAVQGFIYSLYPASHRRNPMIERHTVLGPRLSDPVI